MNVKGSLAKYILENIISDIYKRGLDYANNHKVRYLGESNKKLVSSVIGSEIYRVEFREGPKYIKADCDCPYAVSNAVAIVYDQSKDLDLPTEKEIQTQTLEVDKDFWKKIDKIFENPLEADLELLAVASDYSSWGTKPHAKISVHLDLLEIIQTQITKTS